MKDFSPLKKNYIHVLKNYALNSDRKLQVAIKKKKKTSSLTVPVRIKLPAMS